MNVMMYACALDFSFQKLGFGIELLLQVCKLLFIYLIALWLHYSNKLIDLIGSSAESSTMELSPILILILMSTILIPLFDNIYI